MKTFQTTGSFMLVDPVSRVVFDAGTPTNVETVTAFIEERVKMGHLEEVKATDNKAAEVAAVGKQAESLAAPKPAHKPAKKAAK